MQSDIVGTLTATFEGHPQKTEGGIEYWLARDVQHLLGYAEWRNFTTVISKARTACEVSGHPVAHNLSTSTKWSTWARAASARSTTSCSRGTPAT